MTTWDFTQHNPFKAVYDTNRRSVYLMTQRIQRHPFLALFDGADTNASTATRITSTTPLQALFLMNDPFVHEQAQGVRGPAADASERTTRSGSSGRIVLLFGRPPSAEEQRPQRSTWRRCERKLSQSDAPAKAWESLVRALFMSNEFVYVN